MLNRSVAKFLFCMYILCLLFIVFFTPHRYEGYYHERQIHLIPLQMTLDGLKGPRGQHFWPYWYEYFGNLFGNIMLFMPIGFFLKIFNNYKSVGRIILTGALISISIELLQYLFRIGVCDIDDVILNTLGTWCGVIACKWIARKAAEMKITTS